MLDDDVSRYTDGNELAGPLSEVFAADVTAAVGRCASCGRAAPMAALHVYNHNLPGWVARCPRCEEVMLRLVSTPDANWLDLHGTSVLRLPRP